MNKEQKKNQRKYFRQRRVRAKIFGTAKCPRLAVYKSLLNCYVQLIDDTAGKTLLALDDRKIKGNKTERAAKLGEQVGAEALKKKIEQVVFDRGGFKYHGRVKAVAESARAAGLKF
ncbi:MAG TPA: 50S ribosomal protein L18 [Candidatus Bipolaricaulota bacterium]|nr:50S ribosomal protein L18 [Candidatus Bipolaricaulota bacterium]